MIEIETEDGRILAVECNVWFGSQPECYEPSRDILDLGFNVGEAQS
jgi:hypothetical protein